jgi:hypothetical protein
MGQQATFEMKETVRAIALRLSQFGQPTTDATSNGAMRID